MSKEEETKGKVIAIQQKLLEIAIQMFQEKKDECEGLKALNKNQSEYIDSLETKLAWSRTKIEEERMKARKKEEDKQNG